MAIDYARMQRTFPKHKAALTRAQHKKTAEARYTAVKQACKAAVTEWDAIGAWPDDWSRWQRALSDAANDYTRATGVYVNASRLEDL